MKRSSILSFENVRTGYPDKEIIKGFTADIYPGDFVGGDWLKRNRKIHF